MSTQLRDRPKWAENALLEAETQMLSRLEASAAMMRLILQASATNTQALLDDHAAATGQAAPALGPQTQAITQEVFNLKPAPSAPPAESVPAATPAKPKKKRPYFPRIHAPQMLALGQRAAELLVELAPLIREITEAFVRAGIDPRPTLRRAASMNVAHVFKDELGIDLENIEQASFEQLLSTLKRVQEWIAECQRSEVVYLGMRPAGKASAPTGPPVQTAEVAQASEAGGKAEAPEGRAPATYSAGPESLDWTKL